MEQYFPTTSQAAAWENNENPQFYAQFHTVYSSSDPKRHELGLVGGNNVSQIAGNMIDLESDLRGITRINTFAPWRKYQPPAENQTEITRTNWKNNVTIDTTPVHLPEYQMWAYPAIYAPKPMKNEACGMPQKY